MISANVSETALYFLIIKHYLVQSFHEGPSKYSLPLFAKAEKISNSNSAWLQDSSSRSNQP